MSPVENRNLERVRYWQGQKLRSRDFNDIHAAEEQRRWWHNRALHDAYGVHLDPDSPPGFHVSLNAAGTAVTVTAGLAYDCFGRELILEADQTVTLPPMAQDDADLILFIRYGSLAPEKCREDLTAVCWTAAESATPGFVEFGWKPKTDFIYSEGVPLGELVVQTGEKSIVQVTNPAARPLARPLFASGTTVPGNTPWELWSYEFGDRDLVIGVQTTIDTSAAGFTDAPCYFAWLQGPVFSPQTQRIAPALYTSIAAETVNSFVFRIALPGPRQMLMRSRALYGERYVAASEFALFARQQKLYVNWVGCQKNASVPFIATLLRNPRLLLNLSAVQISKLPDLSVLAAILSRPTKP